MVKIAMIGAGSVVFSKSLTGDILSFPEFADATLSYMDIDAQRLEVGAALCAKVAAGLGAKPRIEATTDLAAAISGADFVINMVQIGGFDSTLVDFEIPRKYGLKFTIADTTGPGGLFRALRTFPMLTNLCRLMAEQAPNAWLLNYSNPMGMNMRTIGAAGMTQAVGLCHSVQGTLSTILRYLDEPADGVKFLCAGINHMAFYLKLEKAGRDLYPRLFAASETPAIFARNPVRFELMKRLGYFVTESSEHNAEYSSWFIPHGDEAIRRFSVPIDEYLHRCDASIEVFERLKQQCRSDETISTSPSREYGATILHAMTSGEPAVVYGNMPNAGTISNLPKHAVAEAPTLVDRNGPQLTAVGELPPQLVGYIQPHVVQQELFIRAAVEGRRDHVYHAAMMDPLTAAMMPLDDIVQMCDEMIAAHGNLIPPLTKVTRVASSGKQFEAVDARQLRESWTGAKEKKCADHLSDWHVIGPFVSGHPGKVSLGTATAVDGDFVDRADGSVDLSATYSHGERLLAWKPARAGKNGLVNLSELLGNSDWSVAFGYAEIDSPRDRDAVLRCGSDDGIKIWLNGQVVHENEIGRGYRPANDEKQVHLREGLNRLLVKIDNYQAGWGFGVAIARANY